MTQGITTLIIAGGGGQSGGPNHEYDANKGVGGGGDPTAAVTGQGGVAPGAAGGWGFGASFCPNGSSTGQGGSIYEGGQAGYVLLVW